MSAAIRLEDLRRTHYMQLCNCSDPAYCARLGTRYSAKPTFEPVTASEVASVLSDAELFTELRRRDLYPRHFDRWLRGKNYQSARSE